MVEMVETAAILAQATPRSFVILDEVGRGTSTYDGLAIAWAVVEAIHDRSRCRCLFATHYHELTRLAERLDALSLHHVRAREWKGDLVLLHEVASGPADRSYGIAVAKLAGLPPPVLARARSVLAKLEEGRAATGGIAAGLDDLPLFAAAPARGGRRPIRSTPLWPRSSPTRWRRARRSSWSIGSSGCRRSRADGGALPAGRQPPRDHRPRARSPSSSPARDRRKAAAHAQGRRSPRAAPRSRAGSRKSPMPAPRPPRPTPS